MPIQIINEVKTKSLLSAMELYLSWFIFSTNSTSAFER